jgi:hypothetical protein
MAVGRALTGWFVEVLARGAEEWKRHLSQAQERK